MNASEEPSEWNWVGISLNHLRFRFLNANQSKMSFNCSNSEFAMHPTFNRNTAKWGDTAVEIHSVRYSHLSVPGPLTDIKICRYARPLVYSGTVLSAFPTCGFFTHKLVAWMHVCRTRGYCGPAVHYNKVKWSHPFSSLLSFPYMWWGNRAVMKTQDEVSTLVQIKIAHSLVCWHQSIRSKLGAEVNGRRFRYGMDFSSYRHYHHHAFHINS